MGNIVTSIKVNENIWKETKKKCIDLDIDLNVALNTALTMWLSKNGVEIQ